MKPLSNPDYEQVLLGTILRDPRILDEYKVTRELFESPESNAVFRLIEEARASGAPVNIHEIGLRSNNAAFVARLTDMAASIANVAYYVNELEELTKQRSLAKLARTIAEDVAKGRDSYEILDELSRTTTELAIHGATRLYRPIVECMPEFIAKVEDAVRRKGALAGIPTGFTALDRMTDGFQSGDMIIIGARPSTGKTSIMLNMASAVLRAKKAVGIFSAETGAPQIIARMVADWATIDATKFRSGLLSRDDLTKMMTACQDIAARKLFINDQPNIPVRELVASARAMRRAEKIDIIMIDYMSLITSERRDIPRHEQVAEISRILKGLARELDVPVVVLSQLTRDTEGVRPTLAKLRESGALEQDADIVILLHRTDWGDDAKSAVKVELLVEKNRNGSTGMIESVFKPAHMRFREIQNETFNFDSSSQPGKHPHT